MLAVSQALFYGDARSLAASLVAVVAFFTAFNILEASLPSLITKTAPPDAKGTASGVYSSSQFLGIFVGGAVGGWMHQHYGQTGVFAFATVMALLWLAVAATMARPSHHVTRVARIEALDRAGTEALAARLRDLPGVIEVVLVPEERTAYLKIDSRQFDADALAAVPGVA